MREIPTPPVARAIEARIFGALLGMLASTIFVRLILVVSDLPLVVLGGCTLVGALGGVFFTHYGNRNSESMLGRFDAWNSWLRSISMRAMLWLLAIAAAIGVVTVLTANYETLGRIGGTVMLTAVAAGLLWVMSTLADLRVTHAAGLLGMFATAVVYVLVIPMIWDIGTREEEVLTTSLVVGLLSPIAMLFLSLKDFLKTWIAARFGLGVTAICGGLFLIPIWCTGSWSQAEPWWLTGWWTAAYGSLSFAALCGMERLKFNWRWTGMAASFLAWTIVLIGVWSDLTSTPDKLVVLFSSIAIVVAHASLVLLAPLPPGQRWLSWSTIATAMTSAVFVNFEINLEPGGGLSMLGRTAGASAILAACGSLALLIMARLNRPAILQVGAEALSQEGYQAFSMTCPQCTERIEASLGTFACKNCQLRLTVRAENIGHQ